MNRLRSTLICLGMLGFHTCALPVWAEGVPIAKATKIEKMKAQHRYDGAYLQFNLKRFEKALAMAKESYDIVKSPNSRLLIAYTYREMHQPVSAYQELEAVIKEAHEASKIDSSYAKTEQAARDERKEIARLVMVVSYKVQTPDLVDSITVNDEKLPPSQWNSNQAYEPNTKLKVVAKSKKGKDIVKEIELPAGQSQSFDVDFSEKVVEPPVQKPAPVAPSGPDPGLRTAAYIAGGVGVVGIGMFGIFGLMNNSTHSELKDSCPNQICPSNKADLIDSGKRQQTFANVGLGIGVVGLAAGVTLFVLSSPSKKESSSAKITDIRVGPGSVVVGGRF
jgi:hypothetical protein